MTDIVSLAAYREERARGDEFDRALCRQAQRKLRRPGAADVVFDVAFGILGGALFKSFLPVTIDHLVEISDEKTRSD